MALIYRGEEVVSKEVEILIANLIFTVAEIYLHSSWVGWSARELKMLAALLDLESDQEYAIHRQLDRDEKEFCRCYFCDKLY